MFASYLKLQIFKCTVTSHRHSITMSYAIPGKQPLQFDFHSIVFLVPTFSFLNVSWNQSFPDHFRSHFHHNCGYKWHWKKCFIGWKGWTLILTYNVQLLLFSYALFQESLSTWFMGWWQAARRQGYGGGHFTATFDSEILITLVLICEYWSRMNFWISENG